MTLRTRHARRGAGAGNGRIADGDYAGVARGEARQPRVRLEGSRLGIASARALNWVIATRQLHVARKLSLARRRLIPTRDPSAAGAKLANAGVVVARRRQRRQDAQQKVYGRSRAGTRPCHHGRRGQLLRTTRAATTASLLQLARAAHGAALEGRARRQQYDKLQTTSSRPATSSSERSRRATRD